MSKSKKGCHVRTEIPTSTYTFKWSVQHFSKLLLEKEITCPDFYPYTSGGRWYSTLTKSSSFLTWTMHNPTEQKASVELSISIVDTSGKLWIKKKLQRTYHSSDRNFQYDLIGNRDTIDTTELYRLTEAVLTFCCIMTFTGDNIQSQTFELESEDVDNVKNLEKLSNDLKTMYGVSLYTDLCLRIGNDSLRVHKAILCGRSPVFAKMFEHKLEEKETNVIEIVDLEIQVLKDLISFLYTASVPNEDFDSVLALYYAADKYDVGDLRKLCGQILLSKLTVENCCQILALADRHSDCTLKDSVVTFMDIHLPSIMARDEWADLVTRETKLAAEIMHSCSRSMTSQNPEAISWEKVDATEIETRDFDTQSREHFTRQWKIACFYRHQATEDPSARRT